MKLENKGHTERSAVGGGGFLGCDRNVGKAALTPDPDVAQRSGWTRLYLGRVSIAHKVSIALMRDGNRQLGS